MNNPDLYEHNPWDSTSNSGLLMPPEVWLELKCKRPNPRKIVFDPNAHEIVIHRPRVPYITTYKLHEWIFTPMTMPHPPWTILYGFIVGSYVLEAFTSMEGGDSLLMWDVPGQESWTPGEIVAPAQLTAPRT